jgi:hypothetical protein
MSEFDMSEIFFGVPVKFFQTSEAFKKLFSRITNLQQEELPDAEIEALKSLQEPLAEIRSAWDDLQQANADASALEQATTAFVKGGVSLQKVNSPADVLKNASELAAAGDRDAIARMYRLGVETIQLVSNNVEKLASNEQTHFDELMSGQLALAEKVEGVEAAALQFTQNQTDAQTALVTHQRTLLQMINNQADATKKAQVETFQAVTAIANAQTALAQAHKAEALAAEKRSEVQATALAELTKQLNKTALLGELALKMTKLEDEVTSLATKKGLLGRSYVDNELHVKYFTVFEVYQGCFLAGEDVPADLASFIPWYNATIVAKLEEELPNVIPAWLKKVVNQQLQTALLVNPEAIKLRYEADKPKGPLTIAA